MLDVIVLPAMYCVFLICLREYPVVDPEGPGAGGGGGGRWNAPPHPRFLKSYENEIIWSQ